ncbi:hypothetical protein WDU94_000896 [Cyamophila willieti]
MSKNYYATLGLSMGSSDIEIKRAYKQLALKYHPDKNKAKDAEEKFKEVSEAYVFLSDKNKKKRDMNEKADFKYREENSKTKETKENFEYDTDDLDKNKKKRDKNEKADFKYREENSKNEEETKENFKSYNTDEIFDLLLMYMSKKRHIKVFAVKYDLYVKLEDILTGFTKKINIIRVCRQHGTRRTKQLIVKVKPGSKAGTKIKFPREGNQWGPNVRADIVCTIRDKPHPLFKREGSNLRWTPKSINTFSMPGYDRVLKVPTLTGKVILINMIKLHGVIKIPNQGLPFPDSPQKKGDLIISFDKKSLNIAFSNFESKLDLGADERSIGEKESRR